MTGDMASAYYSSGEKLLTKNQLAGGAALTVAEFALGKLDLEAVATAVDAGCGWGRFAIPLLQRAPRVTDLICTDVSPSMVRTCRSVVAREGLRAEFVTADVEKLPLRCRSVDLAMANHMLYELAHPSTALAELARILKPDGQLLTTTYSNSKRTPQEILHFRTMAAIGHPYPDPAPLSFSLENGRDHLLQFFKHAVCHVLTEKTSVDDPDLFLQIYLQTGGFDWARRDEAIPVETRARIPEVYRSLTEQWIAEKGEVTTEIDWTSFVATEPRSLT